MRFRKTDVTSALAPDSTIALWGACVAALMLANPALGQEAGPAAPESPFCFLPPDPSAPWLPLTPMPHEANILAPRPASDCQFYRPAWQRFMVAMQPVNGAPAFLHYPSFATIFDTSKTVSAVEASPRTMLMLQPRNIQRPNNPSAQQQKLIDDTQAGIGGGPGGNLIDQHGHIIYYEIHVNPAFLQFLQDESLRTADGIHSADPTLSFLGTSLDVPTGLNTNLVEYKSAWMIVDAKHPPTNYVVVAASVPHWVRSGDKLVQDTKDGRPVFDTVKVALIAIHVVFTLPGHPEMIWSTFEHAHIDAKTGEAVRDNAPALSDNPPLAPATLPDTAISNENFPLYKAGTHPKDANQFHLLKDIVPLWDAASQSFQNKDGTPFQTSVYRPFPGSKTNGSKKNPDHREDSEVIAVNDNATAMFADASRHGQMATGDQRQNYRLVGAIWLDQPLAGATPVFQPRASFYIPETASTDDDGQAIAGEGRLGSTAMESFTEDDNAEPNCFSCHDTSAVRDRRTLLCNSNLNVSHVLSKFIDGLPAPTTPIICPKG